MKGKERTIRALNFEAADRIPIAGGWIKHAGFLEKASGISLKYKFRMNEWENPLRAVVQAYKNVGADIIPYDIVLPEKADEVTESGCSKIRGLNISPDLTFRSPEDVVTKYVQNLSSPNDLRESFEFEKEYEEFTRIAKEAQDELGDDMLWMPQADPIGFHSGLDRFGYKNYLLALIRHTGSMARYFEHFGELARLHNDVMAAAMVEENLDSPCVMLGSDICGNHGPMVPPKLLDEIYFPYVKRAIEPLQRKGIKTIWHCDGNVTPIFDSLLDLGVDGFQGFQEETGVNFPKIMAMKAKSGEPLIVFGSISVTTTLPFGTVEDVKRDVERCIDLAEGRGGFVLMTANIAQPDTPIENIFAMYRHAAKYGTGK